MESYIRRLNKIPIVAFSYLGSGTKYSLYFDFKDENNFKRKDRELDYKKIFYSLPYKEKHGGGCMNHFYWYRWYLEEIPEEIRKEVLANIIDNFDYPLLYIEPDEMYRR